MAQRKERQFIGIIMLAFICSLLFGTFSEAKEFQFTGQYKCEWFETKTKADDKPTAFEVAATSCFQHFKAGRVLSENEGLDIIDVCANLRTK